jgi:AAA domain
MINLRLRRLTIFGHHANRVVEFSDRLNVIVGPYGSGKSSLLELIKFALGGSAILSEAVSTGVASVRLEVLLAERPAAFEREIGSLRLIVTSGGEVEARLHATNSNAKGLVLASAYLTEALGLPVLQVRRSSRSDSTKPETISFWDLYRYAYISQDNMGQSIAGHADSILNGKRRRAFELMFGLVDEQIADLQVREGQAKEALRGRQSRIKDVSSFLAAVQVPTRGQVAERIEILRSASAAAREQLRVVRQSGRGLTPSLNGARNAFGQLRHRVAELDKAIAELQVEIASRSQLDAQLSIDADRATRQADGRNSSHPLTFTNVLAASNR